MGFTRDGCRIIGGSDRLRRHRPAPSRRRPSGAALRGKRIAYVAQSAAASFNPAHRLIDQYCEAPVQHGVMSARRGRARRGRALPPDAAAEPRRDRLPLSAPGLGRPAAAGDDGDGDGLPARPDHLRRADHRARRHHPDRGAGGDPRHRRAVRHRGDLHHPRPRGGGADGRPHQGAAAAATRSRRPTRADAGGAAGRTTPSRSGRCAAMHGRQQPPATGTPLVSVRGVTAGLRQGAGAEGRQLRHPRPPHRRGGGRDRLGQVDRRPRHHRPAAADRGRGAVRRQAAAARLPPPHARPAAAGADDLPDGRHRAEPQAAAARDHRPAGADLSRPAGQGAGRRASASCST